jgi:hypothetical protein
MRWTPMPLLVVAALALAPAGSARAGGIGIYDLTGFHAGVDTADPEGGDGTWLDQGGGLEVWIGGRDARVNGRVRVFYNLVHPAEAHARHFGLALFGVEVQLLKELGTPFGLHAFADIGPAFLAAEHGEFGMADLGIGLHGDLAQHLQVVVEVGGQLRFRRQLWGGAVLMAGLRFPID